MRELAEKRNVCRRILASVVNLCALLVSGNFRQLEKGKGRHFWARSKLEPHEQSTIAYVRRGALRSGCLRKQEAHCEGGE